MKRILCSLTAFLAITMVVSASGCAAKQSVETATLYPDATPGRIKEFQDRAHLSTAGATFLALTKLEVSSSDKNLYKMVATFPTNTRADITLRMTPNQKYTPTQEELTANPSDQVLNAGLTYSMTGTTLNLKLKYFLPKNALAASNGASVKPVVSQLFMTKGAASLPYQPVVYRGMSPRYEVTQYADGAGEKSGTTVALEVALGEAAEGFVSKAEEVIIEQAIGIKEVGSPLATTFTSAFDVLEALNTSAEYQDLVAQLDESEALARNPINPLTQKAYEEDPNLRQSILDEIAAARVELQADAAAQFLNSEISVAAGLLGLPWLEVGMAPVVDWNNRTLRQVMQERVGGIRRMVTSGTGPLGPRPGSTGTGATGVPSDTGTVDNGNPDGTATIVWGDWVGNYEGVMKETFTTAGSTVTMTDRGTITFKVMPDSSVVGSGRGHFAYHNVRPNGRTDGETDYSFDLGGGAVGGDLFLTVASAPSPMMFNLVAVTDGQTESTPWFVGIMLPQGTLKLKSGETLHQNETNNMQGVESTQTRTVTITETVRRTVPASTAPRTSRPPTTTPRPTTTSPPTTRPPTTTPPPTTEAPTRTASPTIRITITPTTTAPPP
jgi:hypothetical protein